MKRDPRFAVWIVGTAVLFLAAGVVGFVWLPSAQPGAAADLWTTICRAVGLPIGVTQASVRGEGQPSSEVAWTTATRDLLARGNAARGAAIATACDNCHGANGVSADAAFPNLAGQSVASLYKQLEDYKSGRRDPAVMGVFVAGLSQQQMLDLATHFASLPNPFAAAMPRSDDPAARNLIELGSPMRSIASCAACHGPQGLTTGAPELRGQQRAYLEQQMEAFKAGNRHNDISEQMRSVARQLSGGEIAALAAFYSSVPGKKFSLGSIMLGFELDFWDYATFATFALAGLAGVLIYIWIAGLPGRIALARKHPEAEAVKIMGWAGLLPTILPWIQAFIWAFKPTDIVDVRRFPREEAKALDEEAARANDTPARHAAEHESADTAVPPRDALAPPRSPHGGTKG